ncbi:MAG: hypothetical protein WC824_14225 [Bacteroidota bacterium]
MKVILDCGFNSPSNLGLSFLLETDCRFRGLGHVLENGTAIITDFDSGSLPIQGGIVPVEARPTTDGTNEFFGHHIPTSLSRMLFLPQGFLDG